MKTALFLGMLVLACAFVRPALAQSPVRYALVIGNDEGRAPDGTSLEHLQHAEREARQLRDALVRVGAFSESGGRVVLLTGKGRAEILSAARRLAEQHRAERQRWGNVPTLFAFFFTGHGLNRQLLTADDPLTSEDLALIFRDMGASMTFGMFDSCFSGSLDLHSLRAKGVRVLSGFNPIQELPREILSTQGTMWMVSSGADQVSYEDAQLGGVLTHFFIEGLEKARADEFGISIDSIWEYASRETQRYTAGLGRTQTPQKMVRELTASGPVYLSYRRQRDAELRFAPAVAGQFLLRYETGELSELVVKSAGTALRLSLFPGPLWIERVGNGTRERQRVELVASGTVTVGTNDNWNGAPMLGQRRIAHKGGLADIVMVQEAPHTTGAVGMAYRLSLGPEDSVSPLHGLELGARIDHGALAAGIELGRGWRSRSYEAWSYQTQQTDLSAFIGPAWNVGLLRLGVCAELRSSWTAVRYGDGAQNDRHHWGSGAYGEALFPLWPRHLPLLVVARLGASLERSTSAAFNAQPDGWSAVPMAGLGLSARLD